MAASTGFKLVQSRLSEIIISHHGFAPLGLNDIMQVFAILQLRWVKR